MPLYNSILEKKESVMYLEVSDHLFEKILSFIYLFRCIPYPVDLPTNRLVDGVVLFTPQVKND